MGFKWDAVGREALFWRSELLSTLATTDCDGTLETVFILFIVVIK